MTSRRQPPVAAQGAIPDLASRSTPAVSGEYRLVRDQEPPRRHTSVNGMPAVRLGLRGTSSTTMKAAAAKDVATGLPVAPGPSTHRDMTRDMSREPRRYPTVEMPAFEPSLTSGRMLDEDFDFDLDADGALDLDCLPSSQNTRGELRWHSTPEAPSAERVSARVTPPPMARVTPSLMRRATPAPIGTPSSAGMRRTASGQMLPPAPPFLLSIPGRRSSASYAVVDPHAALIAFAGFGDAPTGLWASQAYALRVIARRRSLVRDLASARARRSPDVGLYEASLRTADDAVVSKGLVMLGAMLLFVAIVLAGAVHVIVNVLSVTG